MIVIGFVRRFAALSDHDQRRQTHLSCRRTRQMTFRIRSIVGALAGVLLAAAVVSMPSAASGAVQAGGQGQTVRLQRGGHDATVTFTTRRSGEVLMDVSASAPDADWSVSGDESSVVSVSADGKYQTDVVIPFARPVVRQFALGALRAGPHTLRLHYADDRSAAAARTAVLSGFHFTTEAPGDAGYLAAKFAPVLYGRNLSDFGGPLDNAYSDTPLVAWHEATPAATPGHTLLQYSIVWSNEDGGTDTPALMARWGRTTDIEWIYRVEIDQHGKRVAGSDTFQAPSHTTTAFHGRYVGDHAVLDTCTSNNNVCDTVNDPMRFFLSAQQSLPSGQPREYIMDTNPWTYQVMAAEMAREGKIEATPDPTTAAISDQRDYLFIAVKKDTVPPGNAGSTWVGLSVGVKLKGSDTIYRSDHLGTGGETDWSIQRDDPAATTVELPAGTTQNDIDRIVVYRVVNGTPDPGYTVHVTGVERAFLLGSDDLPQSSFLTWSGSLTLTAAAPTATLWSAA
jgi:hypothetical protein